MSAEAPTGFLGLSHLGVVTSIGWASLGGSVSAVDLDPTPVSMLRQGELPVLEPGLDDLFANSRSRMKFATDPAGLSDSALVIVSRDVPTDASNVSDTSALLDLIDAAIPHLRPGVTLALMSQVPPGFTRRLAERIRGRRPDLTFHLYNWVETLIFGNAVERYLEPERIIIGCDNPVGNLPPELEQGVKRFGCPVFRMSYESAELLKTAINLYLCATLTYANTMSDLSEALGASWPEMVPALRLDQRIGPAAYLRPGLGIAGGNLERDLVTLASLCRSTGVDASFVDAMAEYNRRRYRWVLEKLERHVFSVTAHPVIAVWGLAYKKNTRSTKNSMALRVVRELNARAEIRAYDPVVRSEDIDLDMKLLADRDEAVAGADCLLILTEWEEFAVPAARALNAMRTPLVIDCVGVVDLARADLQGARYLSMGRPA